MCYLAITVDKVSAVAVDRGWDAAGEEGSEVVFSSCVEESISSCFKDESSDVQSDYSFIRREVGDCCVIVVVVVMERCGCIEQGSGGIELMKGRWNAMR